MSGTGLGGVGGNLGNIQDTTKKIQDSAKKITDSATTPVAPSKYPKTASPAKLEDTEFMDRSIEHGISSYNPSDGGLKFKLGAGVTNIPFVDIMEGAGQLSNKDANPLTNPLITDYNAGAGVNAEVKLNRERWSLGLKVSGAGSFQTSGVEKNANDFASLQDQAKTLESQMSALETQVNQVSNNLQNNANFKRAEEIIGQLNSNSGSVTPEMVSELQTILNSGEIQKLFTDLESTIGKMNSTIGTANNALGILGDGTRSIVADVAVRGAAEVTAGYRTERYNLGKGWGIRGGIEGALIVPLPNPVNTPSDNGLPQFKYSMAKASTHVQVTTSGLKDLQTRLSSMQENLSALQTASGNTAAAVNKASEVANKVDPNNPLSVLQNYGDIMTSIDALNKAATETGKSSDALGKNLTGLSDDLEKVKVSTSVGVTTVTPTAPVGFGIKDIGVTLDGPLGKNTKMSFSTGFMNPVGYLQGERTNYALLRGPDDKYKLEKTGSEKGNVYHDFYDPTLYSGLGFTFNEGKWYKTTVDTRFEKSLSSDVMRASGIVKQNVGPFSLRAGVLNTDLINAKDNMMYMAGIGIGSVKNPDLFTIDAATNSFNKDEIKDVAVKAGINIHF